MEKLSPKTVLVITLLIKVKVTTFPYSVIGVVER